MNIKYIVITTSLVALSNLAHSSEYSSLINEQNTTYNSMTEEVDQMENANHPLSEMSKKARGKVLLACFDQNSIENTNQNLINQSIDADILHLFSAATRNNFIEICAKTFRNGKISSLYHETLRKHCFRLARIILGSKLVHVDCKNSNGFTGLMLAADNYDADLLNFLIAEEANLEITHDMTGHTALEILADQYQLENAEKQTIAAHILVKAGAKSKKAKKFARKKGNPILFSSDLAIFCPIQ